MKRICALAECSSLFTPNTRTQLYCHPKCQLKANYSRTVKRDRRLKAKKKANEFYYKWSAQ